VEQHTGDLSKVPGFARKYMTRLEGFKRKNKGTIRLSTVDLLIQLACFVKKFDRKSIWSKLIGTRRSTVPSLPLQ
jgi:hypothetical protein